MSLLLFFNTDAGSGDVTWDRDDTTVIQADDSVITAVVAIRVEENP